MTTSFISSSMKAETRRHISTTSPKQRDLKEEYSEAVAQLQDIFPAWSAEDLALALSDVNGDLEIVIHRISEGHIQPWSEQGKKPAQAAIEKSAAPRRNGRQQRLVRDTPRATTNRTRHSPSAPRTQNQPATNATQASSLNKTCDMSSGGVEPQVQDESHDKMVKTATSPSLAGAPREHTEAHPQRVVSGTTDGSLGELLTASTSTKGREILLAEPVRYRSKHSQKIESREHKQARPTTANAPHEPSEESLHLYVQGIVGEAEQNLPDSGDAAVAPLSALSEMSLSANTHASAPHDNLASLPIVQMPSSLSSRISTAHLVQPVVVLPLRATMRPGLSVNFGGSLQHPRQQQQPIGMQTEQSTSTASVGGYNQPAYYAATVSDDSPRRLYDVSPTEALKANPAIMSTVPTAPSASYRTMGIETSIEGYVGEFTPGSTTASQQARKNQPIQRPSMPRDSFTVSSPPPGLRPTSASASSATSATSSETIMMADEMRVKGHHQQTFLPEDSSSGESAPGLGPYYHQIHQHHHQYQQPSHHDRSYPHGRSHAGTNVHYQQQQHPSQQQPTRPNPSSPAYHQGYANAYTSRPFDSIVPTGGNSGSVNNKPPFDSSDRLSNGSNPNVPAVPWSPYVNSAASPNQPPGQYYSNAGVYSQGFYSDDHQLGYGPAMPLQQHSSASRQTHQYHHQYGRPVQQQQSTQHMMDQPVVPEAAVGGMQYSSFYGHANAGNHGIHSTYSGASGMASGNRRNPPGYLHPQPSTKNL